MYKNLHDLHSTLKISYSLGFSNRPEKQTWTKKHVEYAIHTIHMHKHHQSYTVPQFIHSKILYLSTINQQNVDKPYIFSFLTGGVARALRTKMDGSLSADYDKGRSQEC